MVDSANIMFDVEKNRQNVPGTNVLKQGISLTHGRNQEQHFGSGQNVIF